MKNQDEQLHFPYDISFTQNRELSWLRFDERVLEEARDPSVPLFERLKFASIFASNLDEFFMIRVGSLFDLSLTKPDIRDNKTGQTPGEQLASIFSRVRPLYANIDLVMDEITIKLRQFDIDHISQKEFTPEDQDYIRQYFELEILPVLSPQIMGARHPFPIWQTSSCTSVWN